MRTHDHWLAQHKAPPDAVHARGEVEETGGPRLVGLAQCHRIICHAITARAKPHHAAAPQTADAQGGGLDDQTSWGEPFIEGGRHSSGTVDDVEERIQLLRLGFWLGLWFRLGRFLLCLHR